MQLLAGPELIGRPFFRRTMIPAAPAPQYSRTDADVTNEIKRALIRAIVACAAEGSTLDLEDQEIIVRCKMGEMSLEQMNDFFHAKAARIADQQRLPQ
jgi:hypothetical protein